MVDLLVENKLGACQTCGAIHAFEKAHSRMSDKW
jgi:hypothetical protein